MSLKHKILNTMPASWRRTVCKLYYPWMFRHFDESRWPPACWVKTLISEGDVVVDVGANIGYVSMLLSRYVGATGRVYSMEPVPETYGYLEHNVRKLALTNVTPYNVALSSEPGSMMIEIPDYEDGGANFYEAHLVVSYDKSTELNKANSRQVKVNVTTLDELLSEQIDRIRFIKIDVEGHEWDVIQGAKKILQYSRPSLLVEVQGDPGVHNSRAGRLFRWMQQNGYQVGYFKSGTFQSWQNGSPLVDYFFLKNEE